MATKKRTAKAAKKPTPEPAAARARPRGEEKSVARLRSLCMSFPEANERVSHGSPTWFAGKGKVFATLDDHHHGARHLAVWLPQPPGVQQMLVGSEPSVFFRPPYVGPSGWVGVVLDARTEWGMLESLVRDAFVHVATKKLVRALEAR